MRARGRVARAGLVLAFSLAAAQGPPVSAQGPGVSARVQATEDLAALGERAGRENLPILLVVSQADCPYCKLLKREILEPMLLGGEYTDRVLIREFFIDSELPVRDFDGREVAPDGLAGRYGARLTPTVLLLDHRGRELTDPLIGINTVDFYGYYLDAAIDAARDRLDGD